MTLVRHTADEQFVDMIVGFASSVPCNPITVKGKKEEDTMLFDRQEFVLAVHQALKEHDEEKEKEADSGGHDVTIDCDSELEQFADRVLELME